MVRFRVVVVAALALMAALVLTGCKKPYRVGERVWVEWDERDYPAYILEIRNNPRRFRVHFDGYEDRWDQDVPLDRIKGRVEGEVKIPPPPEKVARAMGAPPKGSASAAPVSPYKEGDRLRVEWRESVYSATVLEVVAPDRIKVHYDGHEDAWDEVVDIERVVGRR